jgi:thioredoxin reductase (NADPH)
MDIYDLIIIGAGPAGLTASLYASRYRLSNLVIGKVLGGELSLAHHVCNFPGFESISGIELAEKMKTQIEKLGAKVLLREVGKIEENQKSKTCLPAGKVKNQNYNSKFKVYLGEREVYEARALIVVTGSERRRLNVPGEKEYLGKGVSYCVTCDGAFFRDKIVAVIGGSDAAVSGAIHLYNFAKKVYLIYRGEELRAEPVWREEWKKIEGRGKGETIYNTNVIKILGGSELSKLKIKNKKLKTEKNNQQSVSNVVGGVKLDKPYKGSDILKLDGVFVEIGGVPGTTLVQPLGVAIDETGHVVVDDEMRTNIPGLFCAGDMIDKSAKFKQAIGAMAQGARAAASVFKYLKKETAPQIKGV